MVQVLPLHYNNNNSNNNTNEHYKQTFMNDYTQPHLHQQQLPIPMPVPMINPLMPHPPPPVPPPNFFHPPPPPSLYPTDQTNYMDYNGYPTMTYMSQGFFPDISVYVPTLQKTFPLHTSILSRSPVLHQRIIEEQSNTMELDLYVLQETFGVVIQHLTRHLSPSEIMFYATEKPQIAIELLEAAEELGLEHLLDSMLAALHQNLTHPKVAMTYIEAMAPYQPMEEEEPRRWVEQLEEEVVIFMVKTLPCQLEAFSTSIKVSGHVQIGEHRTKGYMVSRTPPKRGWMDLARAYAALPQHLMIRCLEHPHLPVQDLIERTYFARKVLLIFNSNNHFQQRPQAELIALMKFEDGLDTIVIVRQSSLKRGCWDPRLYNQ
ncbi:hypothetical protein BD560DRAFT_480913 [Blakeslea trispora]|nr:hypothetical protein BD560DRAFT_480913 [Blakeslea trispora]